MSAQISGLKAKVSAYMSEARRILPSITKRAAQEISRMVDTLLPERLKRDDYIPVVMWMFDSTEAGFVPGPEIGAHKRSTIPSQYVVEAFGIRVGFSLPDFLLKKYQNCTLDFMGGRFLFIDETMRALLELDSSRDAK